MTVAFGNVGVRVFVKGVQLATAQLNALRTSISQVGDIPAGIGRVSTGLSGISGSSSTAIAGLQNFQKQIIRTGRSLTTFGSVLSTVGFRMTALISLPIVAALGGITKAALDFETGLVGLRTKVRLTEEEVALLGNELLRVAPALGVKPVELLDAAYFVLSRGIRDTSIALNIIEKSAQASAIGLGDTADIAKLATAIMVSYGATTLSAAEQNEFLTKTLDILISSVQFGSLEADEMTDAFGKTVGTAATLGVGFAELTAFVGTFAASNATARESQTAVNRVLLSFIKVTPKAEKALARIGLTAEGARELLAEQGLAGAMIFLAREFEKAGVPLSDFIGRTTGLNAALFLTEGALDLYLETLAATTNASGELDEAFKIVTQSTQFQIDVLTATIQAMAITIGNLLLPALNSIVAAVAPVVAAIAKFAEANPRIIALATVFALLAAAIGPIVIVIGLFVSSLGAIVTAAGAVIGVLTFLVSGVLGPLLLVIGVLAATIAGLFLNSLDDMAEKLDLTFSDIADRAIEWGRNIIIQLARGLVQGASAVVQALINIGNVIASFLAPGSPPRLLPDLPQWGAAAMTEFIRGFSLADFSTFDELSSTISNLFRSLGDDAIADSDISERILGSRSAIARAIEQMRTLGTVSAETLRMISGSFGAISANVREYTLTLLQLQIATEAVAAAQEEVNRINEAFESITSPLNDELEDIADRRQDVVDSMREEELQRILADPRAPDLARELALLELREIELRRQIAAEEDVRDAALETAEARLEAAQAEQERLQMQADLQKAIIDAQIENNRLLNEQATALEKVASALGGLADVLGAGGIFDAIELPEFTLSEIIGEGITSLGEELQKDLQGLFDELLAIFQPLIDKIDELGEVWARVFLGLADVDVSIDDVVGKLFSFFGAALVLQTVLAPVGGLTGLIGLFGSAFVFLAGSIKTAILGFGGLLIAGGPVTIALGLALLAVGLLVKEFGSFKEAADAVKETFTGTGTFGPDGPIGPAVIAVGLFISNFVKDAIEDVGDFIRETTLSISIWIIDVIAAFDQWRRDVGQIFVDWGENLDQTIDDWIADTIESIDTWITDQISAFFNAGRDFIMSIDDGIRSLGNIIRNTLLSMAQAAWDAVRGFFGANSPSILAMELGSDIAKGLATGLADVIPAVSATLDMGALVAATQMAATSSAPMATSSAGPVMSGNTVNIDMQNNISTPFDEAVFDARVLRVVSRAVRV